MFWPILAIHAEAGTPIRCDESDLSRADERHCENRDTN